MSVSVTMPRLGESVTEGTVTRWLKNEGDHVEADEPLLEVSTDKVDTEVPSPASGTLTSIKVREDETVEIGVELAVIGQDGAPAAEASAPQAAAPLQPAAPVAQPAPPVAQPAPPIPPVQPAPPPMAPAAPPAAPAPVAQPEPAPAPVPVQAVAPPPQPEPAPPVNGAPRWAPSPAPQAPPVPATEAADEDDDLAGTYVTPLVRKLATEYGVDLTAIAGTGVGGRIRKSDVLAAAERAAAAKAEAAAAAAAPSVEPVAVPTAYAPPPAQPPGVEAAPVAAPSPVAEPAAAAAAAPAPVVARGQVEKMSRLRQTIAARMVESLHVSAQLTTVVEVDVTKIARLRERAKAAFEAREGVKLSFLPFFAVATVEALKAHPALNASIDTEAKTITYHDAEHLGIAVDTDRGLLAPVIHNAGDLNLAGLARKIADLAERTRTNKISPDELSGGTFTLTNTGSRGALFDTPIINQPQVGILGTGAVVKRPVVVTDPELGETIAIRSMVYLALTYDHRIVDGADAARFLGTIKSRLEAGAFERTLGLA
ncbi:MAG TPA: 2-oxo acid dehydrogenase subunit E2 [Jatrophihabitantaceae bacterium]|nr:2-oxo acid dehydrogenase subunit E2 [Jatrophihabitantaceae bacterium]